MIKIRHQSLRGSIKSILSGLGSRNRHPKRTLDMLHGLVLASYGIEMERSERQELTAILNRVQYYTTRELYRQKAMLHLFHGSEYFGPRDRNGDGS